MSIIFSDGAIHIEPWVLALVACVRYACKAWVSYWDSAGW